MAEKYLYNSVICLKDAMFYLIRTENQQRIAVIMFNVTDINR